MPIEDKLAELVPRMKAAKARYAETGAEADWQTLDALKTEVLLAEIRCGLPGDYFDVFDQPEVRHSRGGTYLGRYLPNIAPEPREVGR